jgi:hypothetical protein
MSASPGLWDTWLTRPAAIRGVPMRALPPQAHDASFQRCVLRLQSAAARLQLQASPRAPGGVGVLLLGAPERTLPACTALHLASAPATGTTLVVPSQALGCLALSPRGAGALEIWAWRQGQPCSNAPMWHQVLVTNDTIKLELVAGVGGGGSVNVACTWGDTTATLTVGL